MKNVKGQILGFDGAKGLINAEDGMRYPFAKDSWREDTSPQSGQTVDFVIVDGEARDIYRAKGRLPIDLSGVNIDTRNVQVVREYLGSRPQIILAALVIFASLFLTFVDAGYRSIPLTGVHTAFSGINTSFNVQSQLLDVIGRDAFNRPLATQAQDRDLNIRRALFEVTLWITYAFWLVPVGAAAIIFLEIKNRRRRALELAVGIGSLATLLALPLAANILPKAAGGFLGAVFKEAASLSNYGFGALVIGVAGAGLIATAKNRLEKVPGL